jgi:hypothetical protein
MGAFMRVPAAMFLIAIALLPTAAWARQPSGDGDPSETHCMRGEEVTGSKMGTPMICKTNAEWAQLKKDGVTLNPDGSVFVPDNDPRHVAAHGCTMNSGGLSNAGNMGVTSHGYDCH